MQNIQTNKKKNSKLWQVNQKENVKRNKSINNRNFRGSRQGLLKTITYMFEILKINMNIIKR